MPLPVLRYLDVMPIEHEGSTLVCLHDPEGYSEQQLLLSPPAFFIASMLDGVNEVTDIQYAFINQFGQMLRTEDVLKVVQTLDEAGFLITERFVTLRERLLAEYARSVSRPAYFSGRSYPGEPGELRAFLDGFFSGEPGPCERPKPNGAAGEPLPALIVPHIDFHRGGHAYAHGYLNLAKGPRPDVVIVFGVAHATPPVPMILTRKHFETPFGTVETDLETVEALAGVCRWDPYAFEAVHRTEHSIEFQAVMLAYLYGPSVRMVPVLCGSFADEETGDVRPEVDVFLEKCRELTIRGERRFSVIAGADLAHVGLRFGDEWEIDDDVVRGVEARDREDLAYAAALRPEAFYRSVMKDNNARRVCGLNCIYSALKTVEGRVAPGELLQYGYAPDPAGGIVSFANLVFRPA